MSAYAHRNTAEELISLAGLRRIFGIGVHTDLLKRATEPISTYRFRGNSNRHAAMAIRKIDVAKLFDWRIPQTSPVDI